jgi:hypothetical protein
MELRLSYRVRRNPRTNRASDIDRMSAIIEDSHLRHDFSGKKESARRSEGRNAQSQITNGEANMRSIHSIDAEQMGIALMPVIQARCA